MGKSRKRYESSYDDNESIHENKHRIKESIERRKMKKIKNALRSNNVDYIMQHEDEY